MRKDRSEHIIFIDCGHSRWRARIRGTLLTRSRGRERGA